MPDRGGAAVNRTVMLMPDTHAPIHDKRAVDAFVYVLNAVQPDELLIMGDFLDMKAPARWSKNSAAEFAADLPREAAAGGQILDLIRNVYDGRISFLMGNHEDRLRKYVSQYAPAVKGIVPSVAELLDFDGREITLRPQPYRVAPGVFAIHGNRLSSTQNSAGQSAYKERARFGCSIVQGHSHRLGLGFDTQERTRFWMETGCLIDLSKADYLDFAKTANWQHGFGLLHVRGSTVYPEVHYITGGRTAFDDSYDTTQA